MENNITDLKEVPSWNQLKELMLLTAQMMHQNEVNRRTEYERRQTEYDRQQADYDRRQAEYEEQRKAEQAEYVRKK